MAPTAQRGVTPVAMLGPIHGVRVVSSQWDAMGRLTLYRRAFRGASISCPATFLSQPDVADEVRKRRHPVDVHSRQELSFALSAAIPATSIVMHDDVTTSDPIRCAVDTGVGRFVMTCGDQLKVLAGHAPRPQRVLLDVTTNDAATTAGMIFACRRLDLIGLHARIGAATEPTDYSDVVVQMIADMARIRLQYNVILTRISLAGGDVRAGADPGLDELRTRAAALEDTVDDACAQYRFPRPALILAPWDDDQSLV